MESLLGLLVALTLLFRALGRNRLAGVLFGLSVVLLLMVLRFHATDVLKLDF